MIKRNEVFDRVGPFAAGVLIGLSVATPVFAATADLEAYQPLLLLGSLVVLLIGLIMKAVSTPKRSEDATTPIGSTTLAPSDLRWREPDPAADIALPRMRHADAMH